MVSWLVAAAIATTPLGYARYLYGEGEYFRAAGEYHRYLYEYPDGMARADAFVGLGWCYLHGDRPAQAARYLEQVDPGPRYAYARFALGRAYLGLGQPDEARAAFQAAAPVGKAASLQLARLDAERGDWNAALHAFQALHATDAAAVVARYEHRRVLSPAGAALASVVPGAGYLYVGQPWNAVTALGVTGSLVSLSGYYLAHDNLTAGYALGGLGGVFWAGSAFGAAREAMRANERARRDTLDVVRRVADAIEPWPAP